MVRLRPCHLSWRPHSWKTIWKARFENKMKQNRASYRLRRSEQNEAKHCDTKPNAKLGGRNTKKQNETKQKNDVWMNEFYFIFAFSNDDGGGSSTGGTVSFLYLCSIFARLTSSRDNFPVSLWNARAQKISGDSWSICESRSHRTSILGESWWFWWKWTISRFRFGGWARHCTCARRFLPIIGRRADKDATEIALHLDFLKIAWISRFQFDPVHLGPPMRPALTDRPIGPRIGKNLPQFDSVRWIARAGSVRHAQFRIFTL